MGEILERKVVIFSLNNEDYGVGVEQVNAIERVLPITRVANVPAFVKGVINLRGVVTPVIDLRKRFGMSSKPYDDATRIVIVHVGEIQVGLIVDAVRDVLDISADSIEEPPSGLGEVDVRYLAGIAKLEERLLVLLNLDQVLSQEEVSQLESVES